MLQQRFAEFGRDTHNVGTEKVARVNRVCDKLIDDEHADAATIAEWRDQINEAWADLLELIDTRTRVGTSANLLFLLPLSIMSRSRSFRNVQFPRNFQRNADKLTLTCIHVTWNINISHFD